MLYQLELLACILFGVTSSGKPGASNGDAAHYLVSLWDVCLRQNRQYLENSSLSGVVRLFFVVV